MAAIEKHYGQNKDGDQAVEQRFNEVIGESALDSLRAVKAGKNVAKIPLFKERNRQPHQMGEKIGIPLQFKRGAEVKSSPAAQRSQKGLQADQQHEANGQRHQKVAVHGGEDFIHRELQEQRADDGEKFQSGGQDKDLSQGAFESHHVDAKNVIALCREQEWRNVFAERGAALGHDQAPDAHTLVKGSRAADKRAVADLHVPREQTVIRDDDVIPDRAVVAKMNADH